jgi:proline iminopeptidase
MIWRSVIAASLLVATASAAGTQDDLFHTLQRNSWYMPTTDRSTRMYVTSLGKGPKVVTLHGGWGANFEYMVGAVERHREQREFVLFDQRGSLLSPYRGKLEELATENLVDDLEQLRKELGEERLSLLAHSMGTTLAYSYLRKYPDRVASLILVGAFGPRNDEPNFMEPINTRANALTARPEVTALLAREGLDKANNQSPGRLQTNAWRLRFASVNMIRIERWREMQGGQVYYSGQIGSRLAESMSKTWDVAATLGSRKIPISVIQGDQDYVDPAAAGWTQLGNEQSPLAPCVKVTVIPRAGHATWLDDPDAFAKALNEALPRTRC